MKVAADRSALAKAAKTVSTALPRRTALPVLDRIRIDAHDGVLILTATDLSVGRLVEIEAEVEIPGSVLADRRFAAVIGAATGETIDLNMGDRLLTVSSGATRWKLETGNVDDWPQEPTVEGEPLKVASWERLRTVAAIVGDRPGIDSVHLSEGQAAATDSYRLAWCDFAEGEHDEIRIPGQAILALGEQPDQIRSDGRYILASTGDWQWWARLSDANFPKWRSLVPKEEPSCQVTIDTELWEQAIKRATLLAPNLPLRLSQTFDALHIEIWTGGEISFEEDLPAKIDGDWETQAFNGAYLTSLISPVATATLGQYGPLKPMTVDGEWWHGLLMPVKT